MSKVIQFRPRQTVQEEIPARPARDFVTQEEIMEILAREVRAELTRRRTAANRSIGACGRG